MSDSLNNHGAAGHGGCRISGVLLQPGRKGCALFNHISTQPSLLSLLYVPIFQLHPLLILLSPYFNSTLSTQLYSTLLYYSTLPYSTRPGWAGVTWPPMVLLRQARANMAPALRLALMGESRSKGFLSFFSAFLRRIFSRSCSPASQQSIVRSISKAPDRTLTT